MIYHDRVTVKSYKYTFRYNSILDIPQVKTSTFGKKSFRFAATTLWNSIPNHFRIENRFSHFRSLIRSWLGMSVFCMQIDTIPLSVFLLLTSATLWLCTNFDILLSLITPMYLICVHENVFYIVYACLLKCVNYVRCCLFYCQSMLYVLCSSYLYVFVICFLAMLAYLYVQSLCFACRVNVIYIVHLAKNSPEVMLSVVICTQSK